VISNQDKNRKQLLVEGEDEFHVIGAIMARYDIPLTAFWTNQRKGVDLLIADIPVFLKNKNNDVIGIIVDADTDLTSRWHSLREMLIKNDYQPPLTFPTEGLILNGEKKIGIWIMPDNNLNGMLEDFIAFLIPEDDPLKPIAEAAISDIEGRKINKYTLAHSSKAFIHTWLAWQDPPGRPFGQAITNKSLTIKKEISDRFAAWLKALFIE
jgi:hypothetical protein